MTSDSRHIDRRQDLAENGMKQPEQETENHE
jgi:hypothetical protein